MTIVRFAMPACAALAIALSGCSGPSAEEKAADARSRAEAQRELDVMKNSADGSAAKAVGDMMADPAIQQQLGMSAPSAPPSMAPPAAVSAPPAPTATQGMDGQLAAAGGADASQAQALAVCRALRGAKSGMPHSAGPVEIAQAQNDLLADPGALAKCNAAM